MNNNSNPPYPAPLGYRWESRMETSGGSGPSELEWNLERVEPAPRGYVWEKVVVPAGKKNGVNFGEHHEWLLKMQAEPGWAWSRTPTSGSEAQGGSKRNAYRGPMVYHKIGNGGNYEENNNWNNNKPSRGGSRKLRKSKRSRTYKH